MTERRESNTKVNRPLSREELRRPIFTTGQVSRLLGVAPRTVSGWINSGKLEGYRLPGSGGKVADHRRITRQALLDFCKRYGMPGAEALEGSVPAVLVIGGSEALRRAVDAAANGVRVLSAEDMFAAGEAMTGGGVALVLVDMAGVSREAAQSLPRHVAKCPEGERRTLVLVAPEDGLAGAGEWGYRSVLRAPVSPEALARVMDAVRGG